ncbi:MAG: twin-arginine translocase TatA/TatE family subunit [Flavobacteriales bacterium]|jgi:sec-independent protein translocase protein TatA|nr:twin-arginine translocase TatA/TatE family subunit [Flavobacteriaceae bacterium]RZP00387.1 MAG: twin-arginine translocase TatA/TatE family subunit [Flavobacteriales bacterium]|tara:strand:+ start:337 stop:522 length:186 start_codon:yes stop_codon:yes gene_type:complete
MISYVLPLAIPGWGSIAIIALAIVFLFGGKKIPELMKGIGGGIKEFKKASKEDDSEEEKTK